MKRAIFPGSFDPITIGHESIIKRSLSLVDELIIAIGVNAEKKYLFPLKTRKNWLEELFAKEPKIKVDTYSGLTVDYCKSIDAQYIVRGLRSTIDFEFEKAIAQMNYAMKSSIETIMLISEPQYIAINSSIVRDIYRNKGDISQFIPEGLSLKLVK